MNIDNQLISGDCIEIMPKIADESFDLILTDPPYGMEYQSNRREKGKRFDHLANDNTLEWFPIFIKEAYRLLKMDRHCYIFCTWRNYADLIPMISGSGFNIFGCIVWNKLRHGTGDLRSGLAPCHEWILFLSKGRRLWKREGKSANEISRQKGRPYDIWAVPRVNPTQMVHPTEKPISLLRHAIEYSTDPGELVFDPFAGSFSTAKACITRETVAGDIEHRRYCCIELHADKYIPKFKGQIELVQTER